MLGLWHGISLIVVIFLSTDLHVDACSNFSSLLLPSTLVRVPPIKLEYIFVIDMAWNDHKIDTMTRLYDEIICLTQKLSNRIDYSLITVSNNVNTLSPCSKMMNSSCMSDMLPSLLEKTSMRGIDYNAVGQTSVPPCKLFNNAIDFGLAYFPNDAIKYVFIGHTVNSFNATQCDINVGDIEAEYGVVFAPIYVSPRYTPVQIIPSNFDPQSIAASPKFVIGPHILFSQRETFVTTDNVKSIETIVIASFEAAVVLGQIIKGFVQNDNLVQLNKFIFVEKKSTPLSVTAEITAGLVVGLFISLFMILTMISIIVSYEVYFVTASESYQSYFETLNHVQRQVENDRINAFRRLNQVSERSNHSPPPPSTRSTRSSTTSTPLNVWIDRQVAAEALENRFIEEEEDDGDDEPRGFERLDEEISLMNDK